MENTHEPVENRTEAEGGLLTTSRKDALASVVVFLVALPLCMGIAMASGMPPAAGIVTGIVGGLLVGFLSGSPLQVSGPAAGLAVIVWELVQTHGVEMLGVVIFIAGVIQFVAGLLRLGQWFRAVSPAVIQGMLAGIGVLIFASQFHIMVDDAPKGSGVDNLLSIPDAVYKGIIPFDNSKHHQAAYIGLLTIVILAMWKWLPKKVQLIPGPLVGIVFATVMATWVEAPIQRVIMPENFFDAIRTPHWITVFEHENLWLLLGAGVSVAFIASAETLLCATAVDQMHTGPRTQYDRELTAQGVGNTICGLLGALPMTGVIVRSSANLEAGAKSRLSTILHGLWLLIFAALLPWTLAYVPTASLAALLVYTGYKLMNPKAVKMLQHYGWTEVGIYAATVIMIVITDLLTGVLVGIGLSVVKLLARFSHLSVHLRTKDGRTTLYLSGAATFIRLPKLAAALERVPSGTELHVKYDGLTYIDHACIDLLASWQKQHEAGGGQLIIDWDGLQARFHEFPRRTRTADLSRVSWSDRSRSEKRPSKDSRERYLG
ncbi:MAG: SulP family inorganic anion transporter [Gemmataceae bacterium]